MNSILEIKNLSKEFPTFSLNKISFSIPGGCIMGMVGETGAGKTTTIKLILNELHADSGEIKIFGLDLKEHERKIKEQIGVVFDDAYFPSEFNAIHVNDMLSHFFTNWDKALYETYLREFQLPKEQKIKEISKGMRMKLSLAAALSHHPKFLILDEATGGLDPVARNEILDLLLNFVQDEEHSILFSSHLTADLERISDYMTYIHNGSILFSESKMKLLESYGLVKCTQEELEKINPDEILGIRENLFGCEALVKNRADMLKQYPHLVIDPASIEEIMIFWGRRQKK